MIKVIYTGVNPQNNQESLFATQEELDQHKLTYPDMYDAEFYSVVEQDITAQLAQEAKIALRIKKQNHGAKVIALVTEINDAKAIDPAALQSFMTDPLFATIERLAWSGSLEFLKNAIQSYSGPFYTPDEIALIIAEIDKFTA